MPRRALRWFRTSGARKHSRSRQILFPADPFGRPWSPPRDVRARYPWPRVENPGDRYASGPPPTPGSWTRVPGTTENRSCARLARGPSPASGFHPRACDGTRRDLEPPTPRRKSPTGSFKSISTAVSCHQREGTRPCHSCSLSADHRRSGTRTRAGHRFPRRAEKAAMSPAASVVRRRDREFSRTGNSRRQDVILLGVPLRPLRPLRPLCARTHPSSKRRAVVTYPLRTG